MNNYFTFIKQICEMYKILFLFLTLFICQSYTGAQSPAATSGIYNVKIFGAKGNGTDMDTKSINKAIEIAARAGGGTVYFPAGNYLSGSIRLKNNITLYLDAGATIIAAPGENADEYDAPENKIDNKYEDFGHRHWHNSLVWGENLHDVSIIGSGMIWGKRIATKQ